MNALSKILIITTLLTTTNALAQSLLCVSADRADWLRIDQNANLQTCITVKSQEFNNEHQLPQSSTLISVKDEDGGCISESSNNGLVYMLQQRNSQYDNVFGIEVPSQISDKMNIEARLYTPYGNTHTLNLFCSKTYDLE